MVPWGSWIKWIAEKLNTSGFFFFFCFWKRRETHSKPLGSEFLWHALLGSTQTDCVPVSWRSLGSPQTVTDCRLCAQQGRCQCSTILLCLTETGFLTEPGLKCFLARLADYQSPRTHLSPRHTPHIRARVMDVHSHTWLVLDIWTQVGMLAQQRSYPPSHFPIPITLA